MNRIEGKENLFKDPSSGAVVNADQDAYKMAKQYKRRILEEREKQRTLEDRVHRLEGAIEKLLKANEDK